MEKRRGGKEGNVRRGEEMKGDERRKEERRGELNIEHRERMIRRKNKVIKS